MVIRPLTALSNTKTLLVHHADHHLFVGTLEPGMVISPMISNLALISSIEGNFKLQVNGQQYEADLDSFMVVNKGSSLSVEAKSDSSTPLVVFFRSAVADVVATELFLKSSGDSDLNSLKVLKNHELVEHIHYSNTTLKDRLKLLLQLGKSCASFGAIKADAVVRAILQDITEENHQALAISDKIPVVKKSTRVALYQRLILTRQWLDHNFMKEVSLEAAAAIAMMNKEHFLRNFKTAFGQTPYQYLICLRMSWAKEQLVTTKMPIQQISEQIGFDSLSSFSYQFRKETGMSPTEFRKSNDID